jgi:phosphatidylserine/phosphatidylglycerophosphate/cardiolipin synthase-like enzyme
MPMWVPTLDARIARPEAVSDEIAVPELVPRQCRLEPYRHKKIPSVSITGKVIAYTSPDSTYAVTRRLFENATKSILIGIYDFTAPYMQTLVLDAVARKVKVSLMLDIDSAEERTMFNKLVEMGVDGVSAPSCANAAIHIFASSHEKVIVIDGEWTLIQSGNYSEHSIPLNEVDGGDPQHFHTGNRDTGLAVQSVELAQLLTRILKSDMQKARTATPEALGEDAPEAVFLAEKAPSHQPAKLFKSKEFTLRSALEVQPILSPDNYMDAVPGLLAQATTSILIEQQYIKAKQANIRTLLEAIASARSAHPDLDVRIVLGKVFNFSDLKAERANLALLASDFGLELGTNIRYVNTDQLVHCHNKMVVVDGKAVLVSSQNWSDSAVTKNREAGLWVPHRGISDYFTAIFETDWAAAYLTPEKGVSKPTAQPESLRSGGFVRVERADYEEV